MEPGEQEEEGQDAMSVHPAAVMGWKVPDRLRRGEAADRRADESSSAGTRSTKVARAMCPTWVFVVRSQATPKPSRQACLTRKYTVVA